MTNTQLNSLDDILCEIVNGNTDGQTFRDKKEQILGSLSADGLVALEEFVSWFEGVWDTDG